MKKFKATLTLQRFFKVIADGITKLESLSFSTHERFRIITTIAKKLMNSKTTIHLQEAMTSEAALNKKGGNILIKSILLIINKLKQQSKIVANFAYNFIVKLTPNLYKKLSFTEVDFLSINANASAAIYRPFGGLPDNPDYNPDGVDNLTFGEIDDWTFEQFDKVLR